MGFPENGSRLKKRLEDFEEREKKNTGKLEGILGTGEAESRRKEQEFCEKKEQAGKSNQFPQVSSKIDCDLDCPGRRRQEREEKQQLKN